MITAFFCMAFTIANLITVKVINIGFLGMETPAGVLIYPLVYILTNVIADVYGEKIAQRTIILGLCVDILFVFMTTLILFLPSPAYYTGDSSLAFVFTQTPRILVASYISYLIGNFVNARITAKVNEGKEYSSTKNLGILAFSELIDNFVFIGLAFVGVFAVTDILIMIVSHWILSLIWSAIAQPFTKMTVKWAEKGKPAEA
ncbi:hypothetical protein A9505_03740 [Methanobrevibacter sp. A27]|nr:hypothetical protein A9505_03740 [Methanobrevibacter sp. A27]